MDAATTTPLLQQERLGGVPMQRMVMGHVWTPGMRAEDRRLSENLRRQHLIRRVLCVGRRRIEVPLSGESLRLANDAP